MTKEIGYNRETLLEMLRSREVNVKFRKQDGEIRLLRGTLNDGLIPPQPQGGGFRHRATESSLITAWDLDAAGWRSFHPESVLEVS